MNSDQTGGPDPLPPAKQKKSWRHLRFFFFTVIGAQLCFSFMNCSGFTGSSMQSKASLSGLCVTNEAARVALISYDANSVCGNASHYVCEQQVSAMDNGSVQSASEKCGNVAGLGHVCTTLDTTSVLSANPQAHCVNTDVTAGGTFLLQGDASTWEVALASVVNKCKLRSL